MILIVLLVPPLYFLIRGRLGEFLLNSIPYGIAGLFFFSKYAVLLSPALWAISLSPMDWKPWWIIAVVHACWQLGLEIADRLMKQHVELIATRMAEKFQPAQPQSITAAEQSLYGNHNQ